MQLHSVICPMRINVDILIQQHHIECCHWYYFVEESFLAVEDGETSESSTSYRKETCSWPPCAVHFPIMQCNNLLWQPGVLEDVCGNHHCTYRSVFSVAKQPNPKYSHTNNKYCNWMPWKIIWSNLRWKVIRSQANTIDNKYNICASFVAVKMKEYNSVKFLSRRCSNPTTYMHIQETIIFHQEDVRHFVRRLGRQEKMNATSSSQCKDLYTRHLVF